MLDLNFRLTSMILALNLNFKRNTPYSMSLQVVKIEFMMFCKWQLLC